MVLREEKETLMGKMASGLPQAATENSIVAEALDESTIGTLHSSAPSRRE